MVTNKQILSFLQENNIKVEAKLSKGFNRREMDKPVYATSNNKFNVWISYGKRKRLFAIYMGSGIREVSTLDVMYDILDHLQELCSSPDFNYWFKYCSGEDIYAMMLDGKEKDPKLLNWVKRYYRHIKNIEIKLLDLLGEDLYVKFYALTE